MKRLTDDDIKKMANIVSALRYRADAAALCAQADILEGKDATANYEKAAELYRMMLDEQMSNARRARDAI